VGQSVRDRARHFQSTDPVPNVPRKQSREFQAFIKSSQSSSSMYQDSIGLGSTLSAPSATASRRVSAINEVTIQPVERRFTTVTEEESSIASLKNAEKEQVRTPSSHPVQVSDRLVSEQAQTGHSSESRVSGQTSHALSTRRTSEQTNGSLERLRSAKQGNANSPTMEDPRSSGYESSVIAERRTSSIPDRRVSEDRRQSISSVLEDVAVLYRRVSAAQQLLLESKQKSLTDLRRSNTDLHHSNTDLNESNNYLRTSNDAIGHQTQNLSSARSSTDALNQQDSIQEEQSQSNRGLPLTTTRLRSPGPDIFGQKQADGRQGESRRSDGNLHNGSPSMKTTSTPTTPVVIPRKTAPSQQRQQSGQQVRTSTSKTKITSLKDTARAMSHRFIHIYLFCSVIY
jgi:hypothetical protein